MMEGISGEAASLAGHLKLANLCWIYDNNHITIEGNTALAYSDDVATRFIGYGWNVTRVGDANDLEMLARAFTTFKNTPDRPTLNIVDSHIAYGAPNKQDTSAAHGEPLGEEEIRLTKRHYESVRIVLIANCTIFSSATGTSFHVALLASASREATLPRRRKCRSSWLNSAARNVWTRSQATAGPTVRPPMQIMFM
jgi:hypothetical protein